MSTMSDKLSTMACIIDPRSTRISPYNIHEWINDSLRLVEEDICMIQVNGPRQHVFI